MLIHLRGADAGTSADLVVDASSGALVHWGAPLGALAEADLTELSRAAARPLVHGSPDAVAPVTIVPEHGSGWPGRPGLNGCRPDGTAWAPRFTASGHTTGADGRKLTLELEDAVAGLALRITFELADALSIRARLTNTGATPYHLAGLTVTVPIAEHAAELGTFTGRWTGEFRQVRRPWPSGAFTWENRRGRTSHEHPPLLFAGQSGYGEWHGEVWGAHLAWSGNHIGLAERLPDGRRYLQLGELLHPGEVVLEPGAAYTTPEVIGVYSPDGLTPATQQFHRHLRARRGHPTTPRKVLVNTWEAVYFDHDRAKLQALAERAARVGIERFVLDDGWFGSRRDDTTGLGDWVVSGDAHPAGLTPLIEHVNALGMEFGIWVEPEMVNPDSDLYRAHPEWTLTTDGYEPVLARHQLVLDLAHPGAYAHILGQLDALLRAHAIGYVKWDMNRDHIAGSGTAPGVRGRAGTHAQTLALYRLLDELRAKHPRVEFESCSSGGARIDFEILRRTVRVWTSDNNDALDRQTIQRGASMLIPPELMGAHIGPERSHTTGRRHDLAFRAGTALFGHLGVEWNLLELHDRELDALAAAIAVHKRFRPLLHGGDTVRFDTDPAYVAHGVYAGDRSEGLVSFAVVATAPSLTPPPLRLRGLDSARRYRVVDVALPGGHRGPRRGTSPLDVTLTGAQLAGAGLPLPPLHPEHLILLHVHDVSDTS